MPEEKHFSPTVKWPQCMCLNADAHLLLHLHPTTWKRDRAEDTLEVDSVESTQFITQYFFSNPPKKIHKQNQNKKQLVLSTFLFFKDWLNPACLQTVECLHVWKCDCYCLSCPCWDSLTPQAVTYKVFNQRIPNKTQRRQWLNAAFFIFLRSLAESEKKKRKQKRHFVELCL